MLFSLIAAAAILFVATTVLGWVLGLGMILLETIGRDPRKGLAVLVALGVIVAAIEGQPSYAVVGLAVLALLALLKAL